MLKVKHYNLYKLYSIKLTVIYIVILDFMITDLQIYIKIKNYDYIN